MLRGQAIWTGAPEQALNLDFAAKCGAIRSMTAQFSSRAYARGVALGSNSH
jgi:hypothetical protein